MSACNNTTPIPPHVQHVDPSILIEDFGVFVGRPVTANTPMSDFDWATLDAYWGNTLLGPDPILRAKTVGEAAQIKSNRQK